MTTSKLFVLGSALLLAAAGLARGEESVPGAAVPATAEAAEQPAAQAEEAAAAGLPQPEEDLAGAEQPAPPVAEEPAAAEQPPAAEDAASAEQPAPPVAEPLPAAEASAEAAAPTAGAESAVASEEMPAAAGELAEAAPESEAPPAPGTEQAAPVATEGLGQVGYDEQGRPGRIHLVVPGDTLWDISAAYLGTPWVWPSIWQDNRNIANPHLIYPGDRIWITPWEMRKVSPDEAAALLAGSPAAPEPEPVAVEEEPEPAVPEIAVVPEEQTTVVVSDRELVGLVTAEAVEASASIVSAVVEERVMLSQGDRVWVGLGEDDVEPGDQFTIFRVQEKVYDPETGRLLGYHVNILGWLDVTQVHPETASALIRESAADIEIGDRIMPRKPPVEEVAIQPSPGDDVDGQISFLAQQRTLMGTMEYVYLNRGTLDGIEVGSPLQVYRRGYKAREQVRGENVEVPDRVVADLLVVRAEPEVSVALIRHTEEELALGDRFRGARN